MTHSLKLNAKQAFSLVELSIVLVILGLLVGGVLSGQSLIRASELRSVTTEYQRFSTAIGSFRDKYFALPGDMSNANAFGWKDTAGTAIPVTSGDGNGQINNTATAGTNEASLFWVELAAAAMIEGSFTNAPWSTLSEVAGTNVPRAKMNNGAWHIVGLGSVSVAGAPTFTNSTQPANMYDGTFGNVFTFGTGSNSINPGGILKSEEAWNIDTKLDDGKPGTGTVTALESQGSATAGSGCGNTATNAAATNTSASYDLTNTSQTACSLVFKSGY